MSLNGDGGGGAPAAAPGTLARLGLREVLDALPDGAYVTDPARRILYWNRAAERITGWRRAEVEGHWCGDRILSHVDKDGNPLCGEDSCPLHRSIVTGRPIDVPVIIHAQRRDGCRIPVEVSVSPVTDGEGRVVAGVEIFRDRSGLLEDLRAAGLVQRHAMESEPAPDPRLRIAVRRRPLEIVGGDFHRVERLDADRHAVLVADVMGHGLASALFTMQIRVLWESLRGLLGTPAAFLASLNARLQEYVRRDDYFATAIMAVVDARTGAACVANAGHPPAVAVRAGGEASALAGRGAALGLLPAAAYAEAAVDLAPGDALLLYTDCAIEVTDCAGTELGVEGLARLARGAATSDGLDPARIEAGLLAYCGEVRLPDDLTLVALTRAGEDEAGEDESWKEDADA